MRNIIQIAVAGTNNNGNTQSDALIVALCDDGTLWSTTNIHNYWCKFPAIPQEGEDPPIPAIKETVQ